MGSAPSADLESRSPRDVSLPWFESLTPRLQPGHHINLLSCGKDFFPTLVRSIQNARESVAVETYMFNDDRSGRQVAQALVDAAGRGVRVRCVADGFGTPRLEGEVAELMSQTGIEFETFRPERFRFSLDRQRLRRLHRKLIVIDNREAFIGGINLLDDWIDPNHGELDSPRLDYAVQVFGPLVASANLAVSRLWWELSLVNRSLLKPRPSGAPREDGEPFSTPTQTTTDITSTGDMKAMLIVRDNLRHRRTIERWYLAEIAKASDDVLIANAYFLPGVRFRKALFEAVARGVRVRLLLQGKVEYKMQHWATQALYDELLANGVEVYEYQRSFLHAKVAVIDHQATVGSSNIDPFSLLLAREANVMIDNQVFADSLRGKLTAAITDDSTKLELSKHRRRPWQLRAMNWVSFVMLRLAVAITGQGANY